MPTAATVDGSPACSILNACLGVDLLHSSKALTSIQKRTFKISVGWIVKQKQKKKSPESSRESCAYYFTRKLVVSLTGAGPFIRTFPVFMP